MNKNRDWKYEIGTGKTPVVMTLLMLALFGGLTIWLYQTQNGAFLFTGAMSAILVLLVFLTLYRFYFYKIKIGEDAFFYQTNPINGTIYPYSHTKRAWIGAGRETNGHQNQYCNVDTGYGVVIRFPFYEADEEAILYLLSRVDDMVGIKESMISNTTAEYIIDGKVFGKSRIVISFIILIVVLIIETLLIVANGSLFDGMLIRNAAGQLLFLGSGVIAIVFVIAMLIMRYLSFRVEIGESGVFVRTMPWNGMYYEYDEIVSCREIEKVIKNRKSSGVERSYYYYLEFTDVRGKTRKFQFEKPLHEHEMNVLKRRIERLAECNMSA